MMGCSKAYWAVRTTLPVLRKTEKVSEWGQGVLWYFYTLSVQLSQQAIS